MRPPVVKHQLVAHRLQPFQQTDAGLGGQQCISNPEDLLCIDQYHRDLKVTTIRHFCIQQMSLICALLPSLEKMVPRGLIKKLWCPIFHMTCRSSKSLYSHATYMGSILGRSVPKTTFSIFGHGKVYLYPQVVSDLKVTAENWIF